MKKSQAIGMPIAPTESGRAPSAGAERRESRFRLGACAVIVLAALAAYSDSLQGPFIFDDAGFVSQLNVKGPQAVRQILTGTRPVAEATFRLNAFLGDFDARGYHVFNLAVHLLAALTLFGIARRTLLAGLRRDPRVSDLAVPFAIALVWAVHPLNTQAVTYVVQRMESLMGLFYLVTLYCFIRGVAAQRPGPWHAAAVAACALGMGCKEVMVTAPAAVLLYDRAFVSGSFREALRQRWALYVALSATWLVLARSVAEAVGPHAVSAGFGYAVITPFQYARSEFGVLLHYLALAFWPSGLCLDYAWPVAHTPAEVLPGAIIVVGLLAATAWALVRRPKWGFVGAWFFLVLAPTSSVMPIKDLAVEHRMYLPLAAVVTAVVFAARWILGRMEGVNAEAGDAVPAARSAFPLALLFLCIAVALGVVTFERNRDYRSAETIWQDTVNKRPDNARAWCSLGSALQGEDKALSCYNRAIELNPSYAETFGNRAAYYISRNQFALAIADCDRGIGLRPDWAVLYCNRAAALNGLKRFEEAVSDCNRAVATGQELPVSYLNRAVACNGLGRFEQALADCDHAIKLMPEWPDLYFNRALALSGLGRYEQAAGACDRAVQLRPDWSGYYVTRAAVCNQLARFDQAICDCDRAIRLKPDYPEAWLSRGFALLQTARYPDAAASFDKAIALRPDYAEAFKDRAVARYQLGDYGRAWADVAALRRLGGRPQPDFLKALARDSGRGE